MARRNAHEDAIFAEEALIVDVQTAIHTLMVDRDMSRAELARKLDVSQARVAQMFSDSAKNLTLRTVARVFHALGERCRVTSDRLETLVDCPEPEKPQALRPAERASFDFGSMSELLEQLESMSRARDDEYSNDNSQVDALAA
jgi:DNA-binding Xre family transcriptional regulator